MDRIKQFEEEAKKKWGTTPQYSEYMDKNKNKTSEQMAEIGKEFMEIFAKFGELKKYGVDSIEVQGNVKNLLDFITANFYTCSQEMLLNLATMYMSDERFKTNVDKAGGEGTTEFVVKAIKTYCSK